MCMDNTPKTIYRIKSMIQEMKWMRVVVTLKPLITLMRVSPRKVKLITTTMYLTIVRVRKGQFNNYKICQEKWHYAETCRRRVCLKCKGKGHWINKCRRFRGTWTIWRESVNNLDCFKDWRKAIRRSPCKLEDNVSSDRRVRVQLKKR